jgi:hypothetical protein
VLLCCCSKPARTVFLDAATILKFLPPSQPAQQHSTTGEGGGEIRLRRAAPHRWLLLLLSEQTRTKEAPEV